MKVENFKTSKGIVPLRFSLVALALVLFQYGSAIAAKGGVGSLTESFSSSVQDERAVSGVVTDATGEPLIAVSVVVKGTTIGTATDFDGNFHLVLPEGNNELEFSYLGFRTEIINVSGKRTLSVVMHEDTQALDELVVTALGIKRSEKALSYNVQKLSQEALLTVKDVSVANSLSGKIAGVAINTSAAGIGGSTKVVMRGDKSVSAAGGSGALYVLDGIPLPNFNLSSAAANGRFGGADDGDGISCFNMEDIADVTVLTGPSAAALYGGQAANGVVMLTTKNGSKDGKPVITLSHYTDVYTPFILPRFQNTYGNRQGEFASWGHKMDKATDFNPSDFFQTGSSFSNSVGIQIGDEKNQTYISAASYNAKGIIHNNLLDRYNLTQNGRYSLMDKLTLGTTFMYVNRKSQNMISQGDYYNPIVPLYLFPRGDDFEKYKAYERFNPDRGFTTQFWPYGPEGRMMQNPYWVTNRNLNTNNTERFLIAANLSYAPTDWLTVSGRLRTDRSTRLNEVKTYASTERFLASESENGSYLHATTKSKQDYGDIIANIQKTVAGVGMVLNFGSSFTNTTYSLATNSLRESGAPLMHLPNKFSLNNTALVPSQQSFAPVKEQAIFVSASLDYKSKVFLDLTARNEWTSVLATKANPAPSLFYYSAGLSSVITDLVEMPREIISFMKTRVSYAEVGNVPHNLVFVANPSYAIGAGGVTINSDLPLKKLDPERTKSIELGLNMRFLNNAIGLDLTLYNSNTFNQLFKFEAAPSSGYENFYVNAGKVNNKGIEAAIDAKLKLGPVEYNPNLTFTLNKNRIVQLVKDVPNPINGEAMNVSHFDMGGLSSFRSYVDEGGKIGDIYVNYFKRDGSGYVYADAASVNFQVENKNLMYAGNTNPDFSIGFNNEFYYKNFAFSFLIDGRFGGRVVSATQAALDATGVSLASANARDNGGVRVNGVLMDAEHYYKQAGQGEGVLSNYVYDATNIRLREASIAYNLNKPMLWGAVKGLSVSLTARNLFMIYNKAPFDPQLTSSQSSFYQGIDYFMMPSFRSFGCKMKLTF